MQDFLQPYILCMMLTVTVVICCHKNVHKFLAVTPLSYVICRKQWHLHFSRRLRVWWSL